MKILMMLMTITDDDDDDDYPNNDNNDYDNAGSDFRDGLMGIPYHFCRRGNETKCESGRWATSHFREYAKNIP